MDLPVSPRQLAPILQPAADQYRALTEPYTNREDIPPAMRLVPVAGEIAVLTAYVQGTCGDPHGTGRHNLEALRSYGLRLAELAAEALRAEPVPYRSHE